MLISGALYAEEAKVSSNATSNTQMRKEGYPSRENMQRREEHQQKMQEKRKEMQEKRMERREKALERINEHLAKLDERQKELNERRARLLEMKRRIESAPAGSNVEFNEMPWNDGKVKIQENK